MARTSWSVQFIDQRWQVLRDRHVVAAHTFRSDAVDAALAAAEQDAPSSLKVCRMAGTVEREHRFDLP